VTPASSFFWGGGGGNNFFVTWQQKTNPVQLIQRISVQKKNPKEQISEITVFRKWVTAGRQNIARFLNSLYFHF